MQTNVMTNYNFWTTDKYFNEETKLELAEIKNDEAEIEERFYKELEFGTGGIRGIVGAGINRMNIYTVRKTTQGLANYIKKHGKMAIEKGVVIAYDPRHMSKEFTLETALVLAANGIRAYIFDDLRPTPELSFAVRYLGAVAGIVITASHNPPKYNGYKVYWQDGAQTTSENANGIIAEIDKIEDIRNVQTMGEEKAKQLGLLNIIGEEVDKEFIKAVKLQTLRSDMIRDMSNDFKVVFTPLHGTGNISVRRVLKEIGFKNVVVVPEQESPDPNFSTVAYPNPEEEDAYVVAIKLAQKENADIIIATDPDCDRIGVAVKEDSGEYTLLSGNQTGILLADYVLMTLKERNQMPPNATIIKTIVTSEMGAAIAKHYGVSILNTLTGFKYIGEKIKEFEKTSEYTFILGYEESYGYLVGTHARDKDAVVTAALICEMAAYHSLRGMTLRGALLNLYKKHGYYLEGLKAITLEGKKGIEKIKDTLDKLREEHPKEFGDRKVLAIEDYLLQKKYCFKTNCESLIELPKSNVIKFILEGEAWLCLRPSGTEPKIKIYCGVKEDSLQKSRAEVPKLIKSIMKHAKL
ncbi:MAG: phospho-sugar mutase [Clostridiales bacterium]|nr:phospho-sugar mutase [Clostridiales bacterium]